MPGALRLVDISCDGFITRTLCLGEEGGGNIYLDFIVCQVLFVMGLSVEQGS
jgi:hypothetical protein